MFIQIEIISIDILHVRMAFLCSNYIALINTAGAGAEAGAASLEYFFRRFYE